MRISGDVSVFLGAIVIWIGAVEAACEAIIAAAEGRWGMAIWKVVAVIGLGSIGYRVWRAA